MGAADPLHGERAALACDVPRLSTALTWFDAFLQATQRVPFIPAAGADALSGHLWNRATLDMFAEFVRRSPPLGKAKGDEAASSSTAKATEQVAVFCVKH